MLSIFTDPAPDTLAEITEVARTYYQLARRYQLTATDFFDWLALLPPATRADLGRRGFTGAGHQLDFLRHCLELRGHSMRAYMMEHLSIAAYEEWMKQHQFNGELPDSLVFS
jgi:hypothetical protein